MARRYGVEGPIQVEAKMGGDYTRFSFDPRHHYSGVLLQQGRVLLDSDLNELVEIADRRERAEMLDLVGRWGVPRLSTPDGFRIRKQDGDYTIGRGRIYVDGILAENHGTGPAEIEEALHEPRGTQETPIDRQPYLGSAQPPGLLHRLTDPGDQAPKLLYLDVWRRELTAAEVPELVDSAIGIDSSTRVQTAWQVRVLLDLPRGVSCRTDWSEQPQWVDATRPSAARLTTAAGQAPTPNDPRRVSPTGAYGGSENRLYRVQVHDGGGEGSLTIKWSRDNASVASPVKGLGDSGRTLEVQHIARDGARRFAAGQWVEVTDDERELDGLPGLTARVKSVDEAASTLALHDTVSEIDIGRNARVRRWDQTENLTPRGLIEPGPLPATIELEDGVVVSFALHGDGEARPGDHWVFSARTSDASVEPLEQAPPRGIHHHYAPLAVIESGQIQDCRTFFPPEPCDDSTSG